MIFGEYCFERLRGRSVNTELGFVSLKKKLLILKNKRGRVRDVCYL